MEAPRLQSVECLRGVAAFVVMWYHIVGWAHLDLLWLKMSAAYGGVGVPMFFVISGFIIPYSMGAHGFVLRQNGGAFLLRRIIRLEPAYLVTAVMSAVLIYISSVLPGFQGQPPQDVLSNLMLHPLYLVPWFHGEWMNPVFWTLAIEFQYYLAILIMGQPLLSNKLSLKRGVLVAVFGLSFTTTDVRLLFVYLPLFAFGFIYFLYQTKRIIPIEAAAWGTAFILPAWIHLGLPSIAAAAITVALFRVTVLARLAPLLWLGSISYSLYLVHVPIGGRIVNYANRYNLTLTTQVLAVVIACFASLSVAFILWRLVEVPSQRASQKYRFLTDARL